MPIQGDGSTTSRAGPRAEPPRWALTVPNASRALHTPVGPDAPQRPAQAAENAGRRILRTGAVVAVLAAGAALAIPVTRTVELDGHLVPERVVPIRAAEPGLLAEIHVAAGDTVRPGQLVVRLRSPDLDEATRTSTSHDPALLSRRARLNVFAPPWSERQPDGNADPSTLWRGGVVLTEDLHQRRGARLEAGDTVLDLAAVGTDGRVAHVVHAWAPEREAQRARPGMPARLTFTAIPHERPRQASGVVRRIALAPNHAEASGEPHAAWWRVEVDMDADAVTAIVGAAGTPTELHAGFSVEVAVEERHETLTRTAIRWARARATEQAGQNRPRSRP